MVFRAQFRLEMLYTVAKGVVNEMSLEVTSVRELFIINL